jgi:hypothetical protein
VRSVTTVVTLGAQIAAWLTASGFVSRTPLSTAAFVTETPEVGSGPHPGPAAARKREAEKPPISPKVLVPPYCRAL